MHWAEVVADPSLRDLPYKIEVRSDSNTTSEMGEKRALYFEAGALEVWICDETGRLEFFDPDGKQPRSKAVPSFPSRIEI